MIRPLPGGESTSGEPTMWRVNREHALLLGGPTAAILQIAHPEVALGVSNHSDFRADTLGRLQRTLEAVYTIAFSSRAEVEAMAERVRAAHAKVRGASPRSYSAFSPDAQMWVLATLIQLSVQMFERYVGRLSPAEKEEFFQGMRGFGEWFGLSLSQGPQDWVAFSTYYRDMLAGDMLCSLPVSVELARHIVHPQRPLHLRPLWPLASATAREFLPAPVGEKLQLPSTPGSRLAVSILDSLLPTVLPGLPRRLRFASQYLAAVERKLNAEMAQPLRRPKQDATSQ